MASCRTLRHDMVAEVQSIEEEEQDLWTNSFEKQKWKGLLSFPFVIPYRWGSPTTHINQHSNQRSRREPTPFCIWLHFLEASKGRTLSTREDPTITDKTNITNPKQAPKVINVLPLSSFLPGNLIPHNLHQHQNTLLRDQPRLVQWAPFKGGALFLLGKSIISVKVCLGKMAMNVLCMADIDGQNLRALLIYGWLTL